MKNYEEGMTINYCGDEYVLDEEPYEAESRYISCEESWFVANAHKGNDKYTLWWYGKRGEDEYGFIIFTYDIEYPNFAEKHIHFELEGSFNIGDTWGEDADGLLELWFMMDKVYNNSCAYLKKIIIYSDYVPSYFVNSYYLFDTFEYDFEKEEKDGKIILYVK